MPDHVSLSHPPKLSTFPAGQRDGEPLCANCVLVLLAVFVSLPNLHSLGNASGAKTTQCVQINNAISGCIYSVWIPPAGSNKEYSPRSQWNPTCGQRCSGSFGCSLRCPWNSLARAQKSPAGPPDCRRMRKSSAPLWWTSTKKKIKVLGKLIKCSVKHF